MYKLITASASEPITLEEAKNHIKVEDKITEDDTLIERLITGVRRSVEIELRRQLMPATWELYLDEFEDEILLEKSPITSITHIKYYDSDGNLQTLDSSYYQLDAMSEPARLVEAYGYSYPTTRDMLNAVIIRFVAGYTDAASVPEDIKLAMLLCISYFYDNRGEYITPANVKGILEAKKSLLSKETCFRF